MMSSDLTGAVWRKSSYSSGNGQCVEVAVLGEAVAMRDSKNPSGPALLFTPDEFSAFISGVTADEFSAQ
jgi:Domain of unknown function (DUF397)